MQVVLLVLLMAVLFACASSDAEVVTNSTPTTDSTVKLRKHANCGRVQNINIDCILPKANEESTTKIARNTQQRDHQEITLLCAESENDTELCEETEATLQNDINDEDSSTETATTSSPNIDDSQAEETFQSFSVASPPSEIFINLEKAAKNPSKPKINQALFSLNTAQRFTVIRKPPPTQKPVSTQVEVMKSIEIPFDSSQFQINISAEELPLPASTNQVQVVYGPNKRLSHMENILQRREHFEFNRQDQRRHLNSNYPSIGSRTGQSKLTNNGNNMLTSQDKFPDYFDFNGRMLIGNNIVREPHEETVFGEKNTKPEEISDEQSSLNENDSKPCINKYEEQLPKSSYSSASNREINNTATLPKPPIRTHRRRNKNTIYNPTNTRNFYKSKFRKNTEDLERSERDDIQYDHSRSSPDPVSVSTTEIYTRSRSRERGNNFRKPNVDYGTRNDGISHELSSTVRAYPKRSQRRRTSTTTTETPPSSSSTTSINQYPEREPPLSPTQPNRVEAVTQVACIDCPEVKSQQEVPPSRKPLQNHLELAQVTTSRSRSRGTRKYNSHQDLFQTEIPVSTPNTIETRKKHRTPEQQREKQLRRQHQQQQQQQQKHQQQRLEQNNWQQESSQQQRENQQQKFQEELQQKEKEELRKKEQEELQKKEQEELQKKEQEELRQIQQDEHEQRWQQDQQQKQQQPWAQSYNSQSHNKEYKLDLFTRTHPPKIDTLDDVFPKTQYDKPGRTNRGQFQYHEPVSTGHLLHMFHPAAVSASFSHHDSIPSVEQPGPVEDILLVSYHHDANLPATEFKPIHQQQENSFFF